MVTLRPYQVQARDAVARAWAAGHSRPLISLPTGCGKTVIFGQLIADHLRRTLVLAHRDELIHQAVAKITAMVPTTRTVGRVIGTVDESDADIVVASVQSLHPKRLHRWAPGTFDLIVIDEAHHAAAPSYRSILDFLQPPHLLGVTATPFRTDRAALADVFPSGLVYHLAIPEAIRDGWIVDIEPYRLRTDTNLDPVPTAGGDFAPAALEHAIDTPERNARVVEGYRTFAPRSQAIVFAAGLAHAQHLVEAFGQAHIAAARITGTMPPDIRQDVLAAFHQKTTQVLVNVGVLTEGYDEPAVSTVILARPTKSLGLFTQAVGRGLRPYPGKRAMVLLDLADVTTRHRLISVRHLVGLSEEPPDGQPISHAVEREAQALPVVQSFFSHLVPQWSWERVDDLLTEWIDTAPLPDVDWRSLADALDAMRADPDLAPTPDLFGTPIPHKPGTGPVSDAQKVVLHYWGWPDAYMPATRQAASWAIDHYLHIYRHWAQARARAWAALLRAEPQQVEQTMFHKPWDFILADAKQYQQLTRLKLPIPPMPLYRGEVGWVLQYVRHQQHLLPHEAL